MLLKSNQVTNAEFYLALYYRKMKLRTALPSGLHHRMCERHDPSRMGGDPPIRFIPSTSASGKKDEEDADEARVKIHISSDVQKYFPIFKEGDTEAVIDLIRIHQGILSDKKLEERCLVVVNLITETRATITKLTRKAQRSSDETQEVKDAQVALKEYKAQAKMLQEEAFDFFEKLLDRSLVPTWREIVKEQCESSDYVDLKGRKTGTSKRGKVFSALMPCYFKMTLLVATQDAAERMKRYMTTIVRKAEEVKIVQFFSRMHALNEMIEYLPCLKHVEDSPVDLPIMNVPFTELDMCTNILSALPVKMTVAYYASKGQHFPTSMKKLEEDLILVEAQVQRQDKMMQDLCSKAGISKGLDGKKSLKMKEGDPIPKKQRIHAGKQGPPNNEKGPTHKLCQLCAVRPASKVRITLANAGSGMQTALRSDVVPEVPTQEILTSICLRVLKTSREHFLK